jgi:sigma-E factor negative regulatory protein RseC
MVSGLGKYFSTSRKAISVQCDASVRAGDELHMTMNEFDFFKAGVLVYLVPSLLTIIGAALAATLGYGDAGAVAGAALGFTSGLLLVRTVKWVPRMTVRQVNGLFNEGDAS